jgi:hypothetical protein
MKRKMKAHDKRRKKAVESNKEDNRRAKTASVV